tara:strand:+ start:34 stop:576 length:543 start_codon:yes stop_codon:yes gene_type:complete
MPVLIYTYDGREQEGQVSSAADLISNLDEIEKVANSLSWQNIEDRSLDSYHCLPGEAHKQTRGSYAEGSTLPVDSFYSVASVSFPVRAGNGVFCFGSVSFDHSLVTPGDDGHIRLESSHGGWQLNNARRNETFGGTNIAWAFKSTKNGSEKVTLRMKVLSGWTSSSSSVYAQLVVFVVDR